MEIFWKCLRNCCSPIPQRYVISFLVLTGLTVQFVHRTAFTLAVTEIAHKLNVTENSRSEVCPYKFMEVEEEDRSKAEFYWSAHEQFLLGGIFYLGYVVSQVPGGILSDKFGPKNLLGYGCLLTAVCSALTPWCARTHIYVLLLSRVVSGFAQGAMFPAQSVFVARWCRPEERNFINSVMSLGINLGGVIGTISTGVMLNNFDEWDYAFYVLTGVTLIWYVFWVVLTHNNPEKHPFITDKEKQHLKLSVIIDDFKPSYLRVLKSVPLWAAVIASSGNDFVFFMLLTLLPQYTSYVLHFDIEANGFINSLPFTFAMLFTIISPHIAGCLINSGIVGKTVQHKLFLVITNEGPCICILAASYSGCSSLMVVIFMSLAMGFTGVIYSSVRVVNVDLAPNLAGFTMGIMNGVGALTGFLGPELFSLFITTHTVPDWRNAFLISSALVTLTTVIYLIWGTSEIQEWNFPKDRNNTEIGTEEDLAIHGASHPSQSN